MMKRVSSNLAWWRRLYRGVLGPLIRQLLPAIALIFIMVLLLGFIGFVSFIR